MWLVFWADHLFPEIPFYKWGVKPKDPSTLGGILAMPLLHAKYEIEHIVNNSLPTVVLLGAIIYYYREIALRVFIISWLGTGIGLWVFAANNNSFHIGMSGVIYAMVGFLFTSGVIRRYRPLQAISLFVAFVYGSMIWGIFPMETRVSWEGHLSGLVTGIALAIVFRKKGPQSPKYRYEIEKEMGIDPPDLEAIWEQKVLEQQQRMEELERRRNGFTIVYHYVPEKEKEEKAAKDSPSDESKQ